MKKDEIDICDLQRIFVGDVPPGFYVELIIRALFVFGILIIAMRLIGKRISARINRVEMAAISTLAAGTGIMIMTPNRGILPSLVAILLVIGFQKIVNSLNFKHRRFERLSQGSLSVLIRDGVMDLKEMSRTKLSHEQVMAQLRGSEIYHLGEVQRLYLESNGSFTLIRNEKPHAGLSVIPGWDVDFLSSETIGAQKVCCRCGQLTEPEAASCSNCLTTVFDRAIETKG